MYYFNLINVIHRDVYNLQLRSYFRVIAAAIITFSLPPSLAHDFVQERPKVKNK